MRKASILLIVILLAVAGCEKDLSTKSDAELGLNEQQARGRRIYNLYCAICHKAYSTDPQKGEDAIVRGRKMMPPMGNQLSEQEIKDVIAYLHTL